MEKELITSLKSKFDNNIRRKVERRLKAEDKKISKDVFKS